MNVLKCQIHSKIIFIKYLKGSNTERYFKTFTQIKENIIANVSYPTFKSLLWLKMQK